MPLSLRRFYYACLKNQKDGKKIVPKKNITAKTDIEEQLYDLCKRSYFIFSGQPICKVI